MRNGRGNICLFLLVIFAGIILGGFIGEYLGKLPFLTWLKLGRELGLTQPLILDIGFLKLTFALTIKFTLGGIIGLIIAIFSYRKL